MNSLPMRAALCCITLLCFAGIPVRNSSAEPAINCHCFQDRTYNPANPAAADDYILATSFNSLLARSFDTSKGEIVMLKMKEGVGQDDLLVALKVARESGVDLQQLLGWRKEKRPWRTIIADLTGRRRVKEDLLLEAIAAGLPADEAGACVADELIAGFYKIQGAVIGSFRSEGLSEKEMALVLILAHAGNRQPEALVLLHNKEGKSWSTIAHDLGIEPAAAGKLILQYPDRKIPE
jgi:hypothetical protein